MRIILFKEQNWIVFIRKTKLNHWRAMGKLVASSVHLHGIEKRKLDEPQWHQQIENRNHTEGLNYLGVWHETGNEDHKDH
jgi:hypothetical protein